MVHEMVIGIFGQQPLKLKSKHQITSPRLAALQWDLSGLPFDSMTGTKRDPSEVVLTFDTPAIKSLVRFNVQFTITWVTGAVQPGATVRIWVDHHDHPVYPTVPLGRRAHCKVELIVAVVDSTFTRHGCYKSGVSECKLME